MIDLTGKCGSCKYFKENPSCTNGWCIIEKYGEDVAHDPKNPYRYVPRSKGKCKRFEHKEVQDG